jgi:ribulose-5-phosphate 4-epimerase/fuculose-1-phosphate aldolase
VTENPKFATDPQGIFKLSFSPPTFESKEAEQLHRKQRLAATFRLFAKFGYDEGVAGHVTCKDGDLGLFAEFGGVAVEMDEGTAIAKALGSKKAVILQNHGLLTCSDSVDAAAWWLITLDRSCRAELLARAAGEPKLIKPEAAQQAAAITGNPMAGWFQFQPLYQRIVREQPDLLK